MNRRSANGRDAVLRDFECSGLWAAEFCRRRGLAYSTLMAWRARAHKAVRFVEVEATVGGADGPFSREAGRSAGADEQDGGDERADDLLPCAAELVFPGGMVLRVFARPMAKGGSL